MGRSQAKRGDGRGHGFRGARPAASPRPQTRRQTNRSRSLSGQLGPGENERPKKQLPASRGIEVPASGEELMVTQVLRQARWAKWDGLLVALAFTHGSLLLTCSSVALIAVGLWWNANTISHNFIHRPFFRSRSLNAAFSCYLSLLLGFPQSLWRARHLAHHGGCDRRALRLAAFDFIAVFTLWGALFVLAPHFMWRVYLPGFLLGLGLCYLQGHYEHVRGAVSHYGWLYNLLLFNDGYHVEHHARPGLHWP